MTGTAFAILAKFFNFIYFLPYYWIHSLYLCPFISTYSIYGNLFLYILSNIHFKSSVSNFIHFYSFPFHLSNFLKCGFFCPARSKKLNWIYYSYLWKGWKIYFSKEMMRTLSKVSIAWVQGSNCFSESIKVLKEKFYWTRISCCVAVKILQPFM